MQNLLKGFALECHSLTPKPEFVPDTTRESCSFVFILDYMLQGKSGYLSLLSSEVTDVYDEISERVA